MHTAVKTDIVMTYLRKAMFICCRRIKCIPKFREITVKWLRAAENFWKQVFTFRSVIGSMIWWRKQLEIKRSLSFWMQAAGEGYYTGRVKAHLDALGIQAEFAGFDISKFAVKAAAKKYRDIQFAVGSIFDSPIESNSADCLLNIFCPHCA